VRPGALLICLCLASAAHAAEVHLGISLFQFAGAEMSAIVAPEAGVTFAPGGPFRVSVFGRAMLVQNIDRLALGPGLEAVAILGSAELRLAGVLLFTEPLCGNFAYCGWAARPQLELGPALRLQLRRGGTLSVGAAALVGNGYFGLLIPRFTFDF